MTPTEEFDASLTPDEIALIARAREFGTTIVGANAKQWEYDRSPPIKALRAAARDGFAGIEVAKELGGLGLSFSAKARMAEELSRHDVAFTFALIQHHNALGSV